MEKRKGRIREALAKAKERLFHKPKPDMKAILTEDHQNWLNYMLWKAAETGNNSEIVRLIKTGIDIAVKDNNEWTALHFAALCGQTQTCAMLIVEYAKTGSDIKEFITAKNKKGWKPLDFAAERGHPKAEQFLESMEWLADITGNAFMKPFGECTA